MAKEWYLMTDSARPNSLGGFENDAFLDFKDDSFTETLQTNIAKTVLLCNSDLSQKKQIRCVIQGNTPDTKLKAMERIGLFQIGTVKAGMYIFYENMFWLIDGYPGNNGIYEKATMVLCQYLLTWQNATGDIVQRWCNAVSASKYDNGEDWNSVLVLSSNTFTVLLPDDEECMELDRKRVFIDKHKENPRKVYKLTRDDDVLYDYGKDHGGVLSFIADKTEFNTDTDNPELRICDYFSPIKPSVAPIPPEDSKVYATISGGTILRVSRNKSWSVKFYDDSNKDVSYSQFKWNIKSDFELIKTENENKIQLRIDNEDCIGSSFLLQVLSLKAEVLAEINITIVEGFL